MGRKGPRIKPRFTNFLLLTETKVDITVDFTLSFKAAMDLRDVLIGLERAKQEMERIQKRLDVLIAVANEELEANSVINIVKNPQAS